MPSKDERAQMRRRTKPSAEDVEQFVGGATADGGSPREKQKQRKQKQSAPAKGSRQPPGGTVRFNANLPRVLHRQLKKQGADEGRTMTEIVEEAISIYLSDK